MCWHDTGLGEGMEGVCYKFLHMGPDLTLHYWSRSFSTDLCPAGGSVKRSPAVTIPVIRRDFILQQQLTHTHVPISSGYVQLHTQQHTQCLYMKPKQQQQLHVNVSLTKLAPCSSLTLRSPPLASTSRKSRSISLSLAPRHSSILS